MTQVLTGTSPPSWAGKLQARATATDFPVYLGEPPATAPARPYLVIYPAPGRPIQPRYAARAMQNERIFQLMGVAKTIDGLEAVCDAASAILVDWRPDFDDATSPITLYPGSQWSTPIYDGAAGDRRASSTGTFHYFTRRTP